MDNPQSQPVPQSASRPAIGKTIIKALGFGLLLAIPLTIIFMVGAGSIISYFRLSYHWGLAGFFVPFAILFYAFCGNAILMVLASFITLTRSSRPFLNALLIGLIINVAAILGGWGYNLYTHQGQLTTLKAERNNDTYVDAKALSDCAKLTDINYWTICVKDKVLDASTFAICKTQALKYSSEATLTCTDRLTINTGDVAKCNELPLTGSDPNSQRYCILDTVSKSWEKNNRSTPMSIVTGCASISDAIEKQFCFTVSLRQLSAGSDVTTAACHGIDPTVWFGHQGSADPDRTMVEQKCGLKITAP